jgi:hypothetical protein
MAAAYALADPTYVRVNESHAVCKGQCPVCRVFWLRRPDFSCDCFAASEPEGAQAPRRSPSRQC